MSEIKHTPDQPFYKYAMNQPTHEQDIEKVKSMLKMETKHTLGPWKLENWRYPMGETGDYDSGTNLLNENGKIIAHLTDECDDEQAETIRQAPDLLKKVQELETQLETCHMIDAQRCNEISKLKDQVQEQQAYIEELKKSTHLLHEAMTTAEQRGHEKALQRIQEQQREIERLKEEIYGFAQIAIDHRSELADQDKQLSEQQKEIERLKVENGIYFQERNESWKQNSEQAQRISELDYNLRNESAMVKRLEEALREAQMTFAVNGLKQSFEKIEALLNQKQ